MSVVSFLQTVNVTFPCKSAKHLFYMEWILEIDMTKRMFCFNEWTMITEVRCTYIMTGIVGRLSMEILCDL